MITIIPLHFYFPHHPLSRNAELILLDGILGASLLLAIYKGEPEGWCCPVRRPLYRFSFNVISNMKKIYIERYISLLSYSCHLRSISFLKYVKNFFFYLRMNPATLLHYAMSTKAHFFVSPLPTLSLLMFSNNWITSSREDRSLLQILGWDPPSQPPSSFIIQSKLNF